MYGKIKEQIEADLQGILENGLMKEERIIDSPQNAVIRLKDGREILNFCSNNYLGLSSHPQVIKAAHTALDRWGYGMSSVRFICGTQTIHKELEQKMSAFLGTEDTILYAACFDANGGVFEPFLNEACVIITDSLNHASIIDGIRLTKARRSIYNHLDMADLETRLNEAADAKIRWIVTDGAFSMDGHIAPLKEICDLADRYKALVTVDDSHATGFIGPEGRGSHEFCNVMDRVDLITTTFGKALGGASGGCTSGKKELIQYLRQKSRPYLFSNTLSPVIAGATVHILKLIQESSALREKLMSNTDYFRTQIQTCGFEIKPGFHPIVPIMIYDEKKAMALSEELLKEGIYVIGFSFPVVPKGEARIRIQLSAAHEKEHLNRAVQAFCKVGHKLGLIG